MADDFDILDDDVSNSPNLTPMVNLALVLVMIFLVTSPYFVKELAPVMLPPAVSSETESQENVTISISPSEGFFINEIPISKQALRRELNRALRDSLNRYVLIRADERVPHGEVEDIMKICKRLKVRKIAFATIPKL